MKNNNLKIGGVMLSGLIIIISFVYAINIQPKVMGDSENLKQSSKEIIDNRGADNPLLCNYNTINENEISIDSFKLYWDSCNKDFTNLFFINNIFHKISNFMINMNNPRELGENNTKNLR